MKTFLALAVMAAVASALVSVSAAQTPPPKTWICHKVAAQKWVAVRVPMSKTRGHLRHGDVAVPAGSQNRAAARAFCSSLPLVTATRGGTKLSASLAPTAGAVGSGAATVRASVGQRRVCWTLTVNLTPAELAATGDVTAAHIHGPLPGTGIHVGFTLSPTALANLNASLSSTGTATATGCETNVDRAKVRQLVQRPSDFFVNAHTDLFPGGALQGTLSR